jgi:hypothetical protein
MTRKASIAVRLALVLAGIAYLVWFWTALIGMVTG